MNNMWQRIGLGIIYLLLGAVNVRAYEFQRIDDLFSEINSKYDQSLDFGDMVQESCDLIHHYDNELKLYHSHSKVFLYKNNNLITSIEIPQDNSVIAWRNFVTGLLAESARLSSKIISSAQSLENSILQNTLQKLDNYSRMENSVFSVAGVDYRLQDNILYLRCNSFDTGTSDIIKKIVKKYPQITGFILDLKDNRGGDFDEAIKTADLFLDKVLIAYRKEKNSSSYFYNASAGDILNGLPIVILTGYNTASAAEIVTAALHEQGRATLIGKKTYGKGCIQYVKDFSDQKLYLTSGYFFSPSGNAINHIGIQPDICTTEESDYGKTDFSIALEFIKKRIS